PNIRFVPCRAVDNRVCRVGAGWWGQRSAPRRFKFARCRGRGVPKAAGDVGGVRRCSTPGMTRRGGLRDAPAAPGWVRAVAAFPLTGYRVADDAVEEVVWGVNAATDYVGNEPDSPRILHNRDRHRRQDQRRPEVAARAADG